MRIYEVDAHEGVFEDGSEYYATKNEAMKAARERSSPYEEEGFGDGQKRMVDGIDSEVRVFDFTPTKANVIAALNQLHWRPETTLVAVFVNGKKLENT